MNTAVKRLGMCEQWSNLKAAKMATKSILRRRLVAGHGFSRLNFFGEAQNEMVNQQNTGNLIKFVSEKS